jgi:hypothetical protein
VTIELARDSSTSTPSKLAMATHQVTPNIFREDFSCGDSRAAEELLHEEATKLVDRKSESIEKCMAIILDNEYVAVRHALRHSRTDEEVSNIVGDYSALLTFEITITHSIFPELMLLFQEYHEASMEVWFPAEEEEEDDNGNDSDGGDDDDDSDNENDESDAESVNRAGTPLTSGNPCLVDYAKESLMKQESLDRTAAVESWQRDCDAHERSQSLEQAKGKRKAEDQFQSEMPKRKGGAGGAGNRGSQ